MSKLQLPRPAGKQPAAAQPQPERPQVPLLETDPAKGLTAEQAAQRMAAGLDNRAAASPTRSETEIIRDNIFYVFQSGFYRAGALPGIGGVLCEHDLFWVL